MDHPKWMTPSRTKINCESVVMLSPITKTPVRQNDVKFKTFQCNANSFSVLPNHITPPSGLTKFIARNPFEADLTNKLHISVISPTVFSKVSSPAKKGSPGFTWSIDELALIQPAKIDEFPVQQMHCSDPEIEKNAQEAISRFFNENQIIPSPYDTEKNECKKITEMTTPVRFKEDINLSRESCRSKKEKKDSWTQTILSLPAKLPKDVEEALKPYFNFTQDQNCESEEANISNNSLRRKLFSNHDDSHEEQTSPLTMSPVKPNSSPMIHNLSPLQSGMFFHGTPLKNGSQIIQRTYGTPLAYSKNSSPCNVSPITNTGLNMSCQSINSRNKSVIRLDFTRDMSVEFCEDNENQKTPVSEHICKTLFTEKHKEVLGKEIEQYRTPKGKNSEDTRMIISNENSMKLKYKDKENIAPPNFNNINKSKFIENCKTNYNESYAMQQSNMLSGNYVQQMVFNSAQDTGYQTYSSSNITNNTDSCSISIKQKLQWDDRIIHTEDEVQLADWRENIKNMISSTPSKLNKCMSTN